MSGGKSDEITLTHIFSGISAFDSGYDEIEVMKNCLKALNDKVVAYNFNNDIPKNNIDIFCNEINKSIG